MILGIDPGLQGALVWLSREGALLHWCDMPVSVGKRGKRGSKRALDPIGLRNTIASYREGVSCAVLERAAYFARGRRTMGAASAGATGEGRGLILGILVAYRIPVFEPRASDWKAAVLRGTKRDKDAAIRVASLRWPDLPCTGPRGGRKDGRAEAALMALYGVQLHGGS